MAATLTLSVDTTQYQRALADAKSAMQQFGLDTSRVEDQIKKIGTSLDGSKIVAQANAAVAAIQGIGGASALTEREASKYNRTIQEGIDKARAMGTQVPQQWQRVSAELQAATKHTSAWGSAMGSVKNIAAGFVAGFTIDRILTGIGSAVASTIEWGGAITDLSVKTGVSMTALQRWEYAAKQSGNTLDQVVTASLQLSKRIEEGDREVQEAIAGLGLSMAQLRGLRPEEQFDEIAEALAKTSDQGQRASAAMTLFGRSGADLLPTLTADMKALGDEAERLGVIVDEQTLKAMDDLGDSWQKAKDAGRGLLAEVLSPMVPELNRIAGAAANAAKAFREDFWGALAAVNRAAAAGPFGFGIAFSQQFSGGGGTQTSGGAPVAAVSTSEFFGSQHGLAGENVVAGVFMRDLVPAARESASALRQVAQSAAVLRDVNIRDGSRNGGVSIWQTLPNQVPLSQLLRESVVLGGQSNPWGGIGQIGPWMGTGGSNYSSLMRGGFNWSGAGLSGFMAAMPFLSQLATGGSRGGQIGGTIGGSVGGILGSSSLFGGLSGLGGFAGVLGAAAPFMGPVLGIVGSLIGKLFGPSRGAILGKEADARIAQTQQGLLQQYGSLDAIRALGPYGSALADAWGSRNVQGEDWFNRLNKGLQEQLDLQEQIKSVEEQRKALVESLVPTWEQLTQAASRYGFDLTELGTQVQQLGSTETFRTILEDLDLFGRATDDVGAYLSRMSGQISAAVQQALRFGTEVPENMRPFIENLRATGQLLDENGNAITDLSALRWGPAIQTQADLVREAIEKLNETFDNLTAKLDALLDKLANGLPDAAERGARGANGAISTIEGPEHRGGEADGYALGGPVYAQRGLFIPRGTDTVPAMLTPGEFVMSAGATRRIGVGTLRAMNRGEAGGAGVNVTVNVAGYLDSQVARSHLASVVAAEIGRELRVRRRA